MQIVLRQHVGEHAEECSSAKSVRDHVEHRAEVARLAELAGCDTIECVQSIADQVQIEEGGVVGCIIGVDKREQTADDTGISDQIGDEEPHGTDGHFALCCNGAL
jgi:hypothetical protein